MVEPDAVSPMATSPDMMGLTPSSYEAYANAMAKMQAHLLCTTGKLNGMSMLISIGIGMNGVPKYNVSASCPTQSRIMCGFDFVMIVCQIEIVS